MYTKDQLLAGDIFQDGTLNGCPYRVIVRGQRFLNFGFSLGKQWLNDTVKEGSDKSRIAHEIERALLLRVINDLSVIEYSTQWVQEKLLAAHFVS